MVHLAWWVNIVVCPVQHWVRTSMSFSPATWILLLSTIMGIQWEGHFSVNLKLISPCYNQSVWHLQQSCLMCSWSGYPKEIPMYCDILKSPGVLPINNLKQRISCLVLWMERFQHTVGVGVLDIQPLIHTCWNKRNIIFREKI